MKTIANKIQLAKANDVTILHDTKRNKLLEVEYVNTLITLEGVVTHVFKNSGKEILVHEQRTPCRMYQDREHFEKEMPVDSTELFLDCASTEGHYRIHSHQGCRDEADIYAFSFVNGMPTDVDAPVAGFVVVLERGYISIKTSFATDVDIEEYFDSIENATAFHDYTILSKDGLELTVKGRHHYFVPTEEQLPVVEEFKAVIEKMKRVGLGLLCNDDYGRLYVFNSRQTKIVYDEEGTSISTVKLPESLALENPVHVINTDYYWQMCERLIETK